MNKEAFEPDFHKKKILFGGNMYDIVHQIKGVLQKKSSLPIISGKKMNFKTRSSGSHLLNKCILQKRKRQKSLKLPTPEHELLVYSAGPALSKEHS